jgi:HD superfamily phosphodiesterase
MKCPGQDSRYWKPDAIFDATCPVCDHPVEFFKDESTRRCKNCGHRMVNPQMDFGCAAYCKFAEQCLGELPPELLAQKKDLLKDRVAIEMKHYFKQDFKRIGHATKVARYAEQIAKEEKGDVAIALSAAYLQDIGTHEAEKKYPGTASAYHEKEGVPVAQGILTKLGAKADLIAEVCDIVSRHHHPGQEETLNFKIVYDADLTANLEEKQQESSLPKGKLVELIEGSFFTVSGRTLAKNLFLTTESTERTEKEKI